MADPNPPENGTALQTDSTAELVSAFFQDPVAFVKKAEDLVARVVSEENRELLQASKTVKAVVTGAEPPFEGSVGRAIQEDVQKTAEALTSAIRYAKKVASDSAPSNPATGADPIEFALGQLVYRHTDMELDGAGINFTFTLRDKAFRDSV